MEALIWIGIAVNILGAVYLMAYAVKYTYHYRLARRLPQRLAEYKAQMAHKRLVGLGLMISGAIIAIAGASLVH